MLRRCMMGEESVEVWQGKILQLSFIFLLLTAMSEGDIGGEGTTIGLTQWHQNHLFWYILILIFLLLTHPVKDNRSKVYLKTQRDSEQTTVDQAILKVRGRSRDRTEREPRTERSERSIDSALQIGRAHV